MAFSSKPLKSTIANGGPFASNYIISHLHLPQGENAPRIILILGPCRVGTTAFFIGFSRLFRSYYQPIKSILRTGLGDLTISENDKLIVIKETLGPFHEAECRMNPVKILCASGVHPSKLSLIVMIREPEQSFDSWLEHFDRTSVDLFEKAFGNALNITKYALTEGIQTHVISYESLQFHKERMLQTLFMNIGLDYESLVIDWENVAGSLTGEMIMDPNPGYQSEEELALFEESILGDVIDRGSLGFYPRECKYLSVDDRVLIRENVYPVYRELLKLHFEQFGFCQELVI